MARNILVGAGGALLAALVAWMVSQSPWIVSHPQTARDILSCYSPVALPWFLSADRARQALSAAEECALQPHDHFQECAECPLMVAVPSGQFAMGSDRRPEETPAHAVKIAYPLAVGVYPVTATEFCAKNRLCTQAAELPAVNVSWNEAVDYASWLSEHVGGQVRDHPSDPGLPFGKPRYRLLSEAEREYVTRAGTSTDYWFGNGITASEANFANNPAEPALAPVHRYRENPFGLFQVHGNIADWTADCRNINYDGAPNDGSSWGKGDCALRAVRGGSWITADSSILRSAARAFQHRDDHTAYLGFRVARAITVPLRLPARVAAAVLVLLCMIGLLIFRYRRRAREPLVSAAEGFSD
jgi:formylglycine-generating enzyme required for sulfatase activity